jgi:hypothetical protein
MAIDGAISENGVYFYSASGHSHDGKNSTLIDTTAYSIYDFTPGILSDNPERRQAQVRNYNSFKQLVVNTINSTVLEPAGIVLQDNIINSRNIISGSITAIEIAANTITANNIAAGAITADQLSANLVLVNNVIRSNNFDGTVASNGVITSQGTSGWAITSAGDAVFSNTAIRGTLTAGALYINSSNYWASNGTITVGDPVGGNPGFAYSAANGFIINGAVTATAGKIASFGINGSTLYTGSEFLGWIQLGPETTAYGGVPAGELMISTRDPLDNHVVSSYVRGQEIVVQDDNGQYSYMGKAGFETNGILVADSAVVSSVVYPYSGNQIAFKWNGSSLYAIIDGTTQYLINTGSGAPAPSVTPAVTPAVNPAVSPAGPCDACGGGAGSGCVTIKGTSGCI